MFLNITFDNGKTEHYHFKTEDEVWGEIKRWGKTFHVFVDSVGGFRNGKPMVIGYNVLAVKKKASSRF